MTLRWGRSTELPVENGKLAMPTLKRSRTSRLLQNIHHEIGHPELIFQIRIDLQLV